MHLQNMGEIQLLFFFLFLREEEEGGFSDRIRTIWRHYCFVFFWIRLVNIKAFIYSEIMGSLQKEKSISHL